MQVMINEQDIRRRVQELGKDISRDYRNRNPVIVGVLKGAFVFLADLLRELDIPAEIDFLGIASYEGTESSGVVRLSADLTLNVEDRDVIIVEDIVDTGRTLDFIMRNIQTRKPSSVAICTLLNKQDRRVVDVPLTYVGFNIPSAFVVGYGLDYARKHRHLRYIGVVHD